MFYNWNRYYNPATGRYISSDPIGLEGGLNTFLYAEASPVVYLDPEGLAAAACIAGPNPVCIGGLGQAAIGAAVGAGAGISLGGILLNEGTEGVVGPPKDHCPIPGTVIEGDTSLGTEIRNKPGGISDAEKDFDNLGLSDVKPLRGNTGGRVGTLPDGRKVNVRPSSSDGRPTIEIQGKPKIKIRYGDK